MSQTVGGLNPPPHLNLKRKEIRLLIKKYGVKSGVAEQAAKLVLEGNWTAINIGTEASVSNIKFNISFNGFYWGKTTFFAEGKITNRILGKSISWNKEQPKLLTLLKLKRWYKKSIKAGTKSLLLQIIH